MDNEMKVFVLPPNENWICDRFVQEWNQVQQKNTVQHPNDADIIWLLADWCWNQIPAEYLQNKKVVASVHHIVPEKFKQKELNDFKVRDQYIDLYHVPCERTKRQIECYTKKPIWVLPFWVNGNIWYKLDIPKDRIREELGIEKDCFLIGSFQRDTEGHDLISPKLEKGPDLFCDAVENFHAKNKAEGIETRVLLAGWRRQYVMKRLENAGIKFHYFELPDQKLLNMLYGALDLYIVAARYEGGPQAIVECACTETPIISTNVGIASLILHADSIFESGASLNARWNTKFAKESVEKYQIPAGMKPFMNKFEELIHGARNA